MSSIVKYDYFAIEFSNPHLIYYKGEKADMTLTSQN